ncbi:MAG: hypothetical protein H6Q81_2609 [Deltaproteobacteria bacterium]|nr:hypothetical protein [Deltaproteobacteria bacterium]
MATGKEKPPVQRASPPGLPAVRRKLRRLRALFSEIAERYLADTEAGIVAAIGAVEGKPLSAARVERMLKRVHDLSVKPRKGRRKDLARIEKAVASLRKELGG